MPRGTARKPTESPEAEAETSMVRLAKAVPTLEKSAPASEPEDVDNGLPCSGRCGRCDYDPCRLHAPI